MKLPGFAACVFLIATTLAYAAEEGPCRQDAEKLCPGKTGQAAVECLKAQPKDKLSPACLEHARKLGQKMKEFQKACSPFIQDYCKDITPGEGRVIACMKSHEDKLAANDKYKDCNRMWQEGKKRHEERMKKSHGQGD